MNKILASCVLVLSAAFSVGQTCTSSNEFYYRTGANCQSGGMNTCAYSIGFAPYLPAGGNKYLLMATGFDLNVYRVVGDGAPVTVQVKALGFPYSAISRTFSMPSIDSATGYGFAPYQHNVSSMPFPSRIFRADPATGRVTELLKIGEDVAGRVGVMGMRRWGLSFSLGGVPFVAYHEAIEPDLVGTLRVYRFHPGPPARIEFTADLGSRLLNAVVLRSDQTATIVGYTATALVSWRLSLAGGVLQSSAAAVTPGASGNTRFWGLVLDDERGLVFAASHSTSRRQAAIEAWDVTGPAPVFRGSVTLPGVSQARPYAAGGGWVFAMDERYGSYYLLNAVNPAAMTQVPYAPWFPQENPPAHGLLALYGAAMLPGVPTYLAAAHSETGSWTRLAPECIGGVVPPLPTPPPVATPTPPLPGPTATPAPPGPCPPCPTCGPTPLPWATPVPSATLPPTAPPEPTSGAGWYCHCQDGTCPPPVWSPFSWSWNCPGRCAINHIPCS